MTLCTRNLMLAFLLTAFCTMPSVAQNYPARPVRIVVPFPPGGTADVLARIVGQRIAEHWGQPVLVDNRPGGGTVIATEIVARAPADGYTLLLMANSFAINASLRSKLPYDPNKDFAPVVLLVSSPQFVVVQSESAMKTLADLISQARAQPGRVSYATVGPGTTQHIAGEMLKAAAKIDMTYIPYPGGAPAVTALLGGHVSVVIANYSEVISAIESGKVRAIAVASRERIASLQFAPLKDVPTVAESGFSGYEATAWFGLMAPAGTPADAIAKVNAEALRALDAAEVRDKLAVQGLYPAGGTPAEFASHIRAEMAKYAQVIKDAGIKAD